MRCPFCGASRSLVSDSRSTAARIRRRRKCLACHKRWTTYELYAETQRAAHLAVRRALEALLNAVPGAYRRRARAEEMVNT